MKGGGIVGGIYCNPGDEDSGEGWENTRDQRRNDGRDGATTNASRVLKSGRRRALEGRDAIELINTISKEWYTPVHTRACQRRATG